MISLASQFPTMLFPTPKASCQARRNNFKAANADRASVAATRATLGQGCLLGGAGLLLMSPDGVFNLRTDNSVS